MCSSVKVPVLASVLTNPKSTSILWAPSIMPVAVATVAPSAWIASELSLSVVPSAFAVVGA